MKTHSDQNKSPSSKVNTNQPFFSKKDGNTDSFFNPTMLQSTPFFIQPHKEVTEGGENQTGPENTFTKGDYSGYFSTNDSDKLVIKKGEEIKSNEIISIADIRNKLVGDENAEFTLNAVVRIAKYVGNNIDGITYSIPTNLSGTTDDNTKIVPSEIILGIALLQANAEVGIDGMPGPTFIKDIMGELSDEVSGSGRKKKFMDESTNNSSTNEDGEVINVPDFTSDEATLYDFFRDITLSRNGLWSDNENITNLTGVRRKLETSSPKWNDTIAVSWITKNNEKTEKHAKIFTSTTEPGNLGSNKILLPQTMIFKLGYHQSKQPALRGHRTLSKESDGSLLYDVKDARGLNAHPGGTSGKTLGMTSNKLPAGTVSTEEEFKANLIIAELFSILSKWGLDKNKAAYLNLKDWKDAKELIWEEVEGGKAKVYKEGDEEHAKEIEISSSKEWLANYWVTTKNDRASLLKILQSTDSGFAKPETFEEMTKNQILALITNDHVESIIKKQISYFQNLESIDGKAGSSFLDIVNEKIDKITELRSKAETDFQRVEALFEKFEDNSVLSNSHKNYIKNDIKMQTLEERKAFDDNSETLEDDKAKQINENVGSWSILCQVVFGPEKFYEFMMHVSDKSLESAQRRWYYTLVDLASFPDANETESEETGSGQVNVEN